MQNRNRILYTYDLESWEALSYSSTYFSTVFFSYNTYATDINRHGDIYKDGMLYTYICGVSEDYKQACISDGEVHMNLDEETHKLEIESFSVYPDVIDLNLSYQFPEQHNYAYVKAIYTNDTYMPTTCYWHKESWNPNYKQGENSNPNILPIIYDSSDTNHSFVKVAYNISYYAGDKSDRIKARVNPFGTTYYSAYCMVNVKYVKPQSIKIFPELIKLNKWSNEYILQQKNLNNSINAILNSEVYPFETFDNVVSWYCDNTAYAKITNEGVVQPLSEGVTYAYAYININGEIIKSNIAYICVIPEYSAREITIVPNCKEDTATGIQNVTLYSNASPQQARKNFQIEWTPSNTTNKQTDWYIANTSVCYFTTNSYTKGTFYSNNHISQKSGEAVQCPIITCYAANNGETILYAIHTDTNKVCKDYTKVKVDNAITYAQLTNDNSTKQFCYQITPSTVDIKYYENNTVRSTKDKLTVSFISKFTPTWANALPQDFRVKYSYQDGKSDRPSFTEVLPSYNLRFIKSYLCWDAYLYHRDWDYPGVTVSAYTYSNISLKQTSECEFNVNILKHQEYATSISIKMALGDELIDSGEIAYAYITVGNDNYNMDMPTINISYCKYEDEEYYVVNPPVTTEVFQGDANNKFAVKLCSNEDNKNFKCTITATVNQDTEPISASVDFVNKKPEVSYDAIVLKETDINKNVDIICNSDEYSLFSVEDNTGLFNISDKYVDNIINNELHSSFTITSVNTDNITQQGTIIKTGALTLILKNNKGNEIKKYVDITLNAYYIILKCNDLHGNIINLLYDRDTVGETTIRASLGFTETNKDLTTSNYQNIKWCCLNAQNNDFEYEMGTTYKIGNVNANVNLNSQNYSIDLDIKTENQTKSNFILKAKYKKRSVTVSLNIYENYKYFSEIAIYNYGNYGNTAIYNYGDNVEEKHIENLINSVTEINNFAYVGKKITSKNEFILYKGEKLCLLIDCLPNDVSTPKCQINTNKTLATDIVNVQLINFDSPLCLDLDSKVYYDGYINISWKSAGEGKVLTIQSLDTKDRGDKDNPSFELEPKIKFTTKDIELYSNTLYYSKINNTVYSDNENKGITIKSSNKDITNDYISRNPNTYIGVTLYKYNEKGEKEQTNIIEYKLNTDNLNSKIDNWIKDNISFIDNTYYIAPCKYTLYNKNTDNNEDICTFEFNIVIIDTNVNVVLENEIIWNNKNINKDLPYSTKINTYDISHDENISNDINKSIIITKTYKFNGEELNLSYDTEGKPIGYIINCQDNNYKKGTYKVSVTFNFTINGIQHTITNTANLTIATFVDSLTVTATLNDKEVTLTENKYSDDSISYSIDLFNQSNDLKLMCKLNENAVIEDNGNNYSSTMNGETGKGLYNTLNYETSEEGTQINYTIGKGTTKGIGVLEIVFTVSKDIAKKKNDIITYKYTLNIGNIEYELFADITNDKKISTSQYRDGYDKTTIYGIIRYAINPPKFNQDITIAGPSYLSNSFTAKNEDKISSNELIKFTNNSYDGNLEYYSSEDAQQTQGQSCWQININLQFTDHWRYFDENEPATSGSTESGLTENNCDNRMFYNVTFNCETNTGNKITTTDNIFVTIDPKYYIAKLMININADVAINNNIDYYTDLLFDNKVKGSGWSTSNNKYVIGTRTVGNQDLQILPQTDTETLGTLQISHGTPSFSKEYNIVTKIGSYGNFIDTIDIKDSTTEKTITGPIAISNDIKAKGLSIGFTCNNILNWEECTDTGNPAGPVLAIDNIAQDSLYNKLTWNADTDKNYYELNLTLDYNDPDNKGV